MKIINPLVSIAIKTYNQKEFLQESIESALKQDYDNIEIVVADDGSTDGTQDLLKSYDEKYPKKFSLIFAKENQGIVKNSNALFFACKGKYIAWLDGDDVMLPTKISKQVAYMEEHSNCSLCYHNIEVFDSSNNKRIKLFNNKFNAFEGDIRVAIRESVFNGNCSTMMRASQAPKNGYNETLLHCCDWLFWIETLANGGTINYIDEVLGRLRIHDNNTTKKLPTMNQGELDHLLTCDILLHKYPQYYKDILFVYDKKIFSLRHYFSYQHILWRVFRSSFYWKALLGLIVFYLSFGRVKL